MALSQLSVAKPMHLAISTELALEQTNQSIFAPQNTTAPSFRCLRCSIQS